MCEPEAKRILVVEPERRVGIKLRELFVNLGHEADVIEKGGEVADKLTATGYGVLLLSSEVTDVDGLELLSQVSKSHPDLSVVIMTGSPSIDSVIAAMRGGACDYLIKPFDLDDLKMVMRRAFERHRLTTEGQSMPLETTSRETVAGHDYVRQSGLDD